MKVLLADDEDTIRITLRDTLEAAGHEVAVFSDGHAAIESIRREQYDVVITDIRMPGVDGITLLKTAKDIDPKTQVIVITGFATIESAIEAMKLGAGEYLRKPFINEEVLVILERMSQFCRLAKENTQLKAELSNATGLNRIIGSSEAMQALCEKVRRVAPTNTSVLIYGESGTGKELIARGVHDLSERSHAPFIKVSCAQYPEHLLEDELFGHEKGAFTNAHKQKPGRFELASGGTVFLDDIDDVPLEIQVKLLRILQDREFERLGGIETMKADVRVVAASKCDLKEQVACGNFREDLFYRLKVVTLTIPPLRERASDIQKLIEHFLLRYGSGVPYQLVPGTLATLTQYPWPGNVRELEHVVEAALALSGNEQTLDLSQYLENPDAPTADKQDTGKLKEVVARAEITCIKHALAQCAGNRTQTSDILGISRKTLWERMRFYGIEV